MTLFVNPDVEINKTVQEILNECLIIDRNYTPNHSKGRRFLGYKNSAVGETNVQIDFMFRNTNEENKFWDWYDTNVAHGLTPFAIELPIKGLTNQYLINQSSDIKANDRNTSSATFTLIKIKAYYYLYDENGDLVIGDDGKPEYLGYDTEWQDIYRYKASELYSMPVVKNTDGLSVLTQGGTSSNDAICYSGNFLDLTSDSVTIDNSASGEVIYYNLDTNTFISTGGIHTPEVEISNCKVNTIVAFDIGTSVNHRSQMTENPHLIYDVFFKDASITDGTTTITKDNIIHFYPCQENSGELIYDLVNPPLAMDFSVDLVDEISLPFVEGYTFFCEVDWGDGSAKEMYVGNGEEPPEHTYATAGVKRITIKGQCEYVKFYATPLQDKLVEVHSLGDTRLTSLSSSFKGVSILANADFIGDTTSVTSMFAIFSNNYTLVTPYNTSGLDTPNVTNMGYMFADNVSLTTPYNTSNFNTSNVTNMSYMFIGNKALITPYNTSNFNTSNVTNMLGMFGNNESLTTPYDTSGFNTSNVTNMQSMFASNYALTIPYDTSGFDTPNVTIMFALFYRNESLLSPYDTSGFNTSNVTNMQSMFSSNKALTTPYDTSGFDTQNVTTMKYMFADNKALTTPYDTSGFNTSSVTNMSYMFVGNHTLTVPYDTSGFNTSNVTDMSAMFMSSYALISPYNVSSFNISKVTKIGFIFAYNYALTTPYPIDSWDASNLTACHYMYYNTPLATVNNLSNWDVRNLVTCQSMMQNVPSLLDNMNIDYWQIESLTNATDFAKGSGGFSTAKYDEILIAWQSRPHQNDVTIHFGETTKYTSGGDAETARDALIADGWVITDGGVA